MSTILPVMFYEGSTIVLERFIKGENEVKIQTKCGRKIEIVSNYEDSEEREDMLNHFYEALERQMRYIANYGTETPYNLDRLLSMYSLQIKEVNYSEYTKGIMFQTSNAMIYADEYDLKSYIGVAVKTANGKRYTGVYRSTNRRIRGNNSKY